MVGGGPASLSTSSLALGGLPWRSQDLARARARRSPRTAEHAHSGVSHGRGGEPQAARRRDFRARSRRCDPLSGPARLLETRVAAPSPCVSKPPPPALPTTTAPPRPGLFN